MQESTVVIASDKPLFIVAVQVVLAPEPTLNVVGEANGGSSACEMVESLAPDLLVLDFDMPGLPGSEIVRRVVRRASDTRVVAISNLWEAPNVSYALRSGSHAYLLKTDPIDIILSGVRSAATRTRFISPRLGGVSIERYLAIRSEPQPDRRYSRLTLREREILHLVAAGQTSDQIARRLSISPQTVEVHRKNIRRKIGVRNVAEFVHFMMGLHPSLRGQ